MSSSRKKMVESYEIISYATTKTICPADAGKVDQYNTI